MRKSKRLQSEVEAYEAVLLAFVATGCPACAETIIRLREAFVGKLPEVTK